MSGEWIGKADGILQLQIQWCNYLTKTSKDMDITFGVEEDTSDMRFHVNILVHTVGKYVSMFMQSDQKSLNCKTPPKHTSRKKPADHVDRDICRQRKVKRGIQRQQSPSKHLTVRYRKWGDQVFNNPNRQYSTMHSDSIFDPIVQLS